MIIGEGQSPEEVPPVYPAVFHLRVIGASDVLELSAVERVFAEDDPSTMIPEMGVGVVEEGRLSSGGKYRTVKVSVVLESRAAHDALQARLLGLPGVRMVL